MFTLKEKLNLKNLIEKLKIENNELRKYEIFIKIGECLEVLNIPENKIAENLMLDCTAKVWLLKLSTNELNSKSTFYAAYSESRFINSLIVIIMLSESLTSVSEVMIVFNLTSYYSTLRKESLVRLYSHLTKEVN